MTDVRSELESRIDRAMQTRDVGRDKAIRIAEAEIRSEERSAAALLAAMQVLRSES